MVRLLFLAAAILGAFGCSRSTPKVVVACAQDREFAEGLFAEFTKAGGPAVAPKFDTEANKSVSLAAELDRESERDRKSVV